MPQIFHRSTNTLARLAIFGAVFIVGGLVWIAMILDRSSYNTKEGVIINQPVPFSHSHHVAGLGVDCRYCHTTVEKASFAGMPSTATCMNCHKQIWADSPMLEPVRESYRTGESIEWIRVHDLPDFVYFNHSVHVVKGIGCASCHGPVDKMPLMMQHASLQMNWCVDCHRAPEQHVRPREEIYNMAWKAEDQEELGLRLVAEYEIESLISCSVCHR